LTRAAGEGFSLLELLIVVAIISLLAALLLPAIQKSAAKARQAGCLSNLRQIGLAMAAFAHEYRDRYPMQTPKEEGGSRGSDPAPLTGFTNFSFSADHFRPLSNDLVNPRVLLCPADRRAKAGTSFSSLRRESISFWTNEKALPGQSETVLAGDWNVTNSMTASAVATNVTSLQFTREVHGSRGNVLHADGHVQLVKTFAYVAPTGLPSSGRSIALPATRKMEASGRNANSPKQGASGQQSAPSTATPLPPLETNSVAALAQPGLTGSKRSGGQLGREAADFGESARASGMEQLQPNGAEGEEKETVPLQAMSLAALQGLLLLLLLLLIAVLAHRYLTRRKISTGR